jgi:hypothetical protein
LIAIRAHAVEIILISQQRFVVGEEAVPANTSEIREYWKSGCLRYKVSIENTYAA